MTQGDGRREAFKEGSPGPVVACSPSFNFSFGSPSMWALKAVGVPGEFLILQDVAQRLELSKHLNEFLVI